MGINTNEMTGTTKKELHIFYVLDTSGSMQGAPIGALNDAMKSTVDELRKKDGEKANLHIAVLEFNSQCRWVTQGNNGVENLQDFIWTNLEAFGRTHLGAAMKELNKSLSRNDKMKSQTGNKIPIIIFMSDGYPNDCWEEELKSLAENKWYRSAIKIAFALGDSADTDILAQIVGVRKDGTIIPDHEAVIKTNDLQVFSNMIQVVSVTSSLVASTSQTIDSDISGAKIIDDVVGPDVTRDPNGVAIIDTPIDNDIYVQDDNIPIDLGDDSFDVI